jgi:hypothetical protein
VLQKGTLCLSGGAIIQAEGVPLARPINANESGKFRRFARPVHKNLFLLWLNFVFFLCFAGSEHAGFHSAKALLSKTSNGSSSEDSLRMKARPAPLESMVIIVERSAMHIRSGPVRALFPQDHSTRRFINLSTTILSDAAELFTASLRRMLSPVPLGHE